MVTYNFTVRARDNTGAFSDQNFAINIRNTIFDRFVSTDGTNAMSSTDATNWTARNGIGAYRVMFANGLWVATPARVSVATSMANTWSSTYYTSPDAVNWTTRTLPKAVGGALTHDGTNWVFASIDGGQTGTTNNVHMVSSDGINWTTYQLTKIIDTQISAIAYGNGVYVHAHATANTGGGLNYTDTYGGTLRTGTITGGVSTFSCGDVIYANGMFVATDSTTGATTARKIYTSVDGANWTTRNITVSNQYNIPFRLAYGNGVFVMVTMNTASTNATNNKVYRSVDAVNWTEVDIEPYTLNSGTAVGKGTLWMNSVTFSGGYFIVGSNGYSTSATGGLRVSRDGLTWTTVTNVPSLLANYIGGMLHS